MALQREGQVQGLEAAEPPGQKKPLAHRLPVALVLPGLQALPGAAPQGLQVLALVAPTALLKLPAGQGLREPPEHQKPAGQVEHTALLMKPPPGP